MILWFMMYIFFHLVLILEPSSGTLMDSRSLKQIVSNPYGQSYSTGTL